MQADMDEIVHAKFEGEIAEMLVKLDPNLYRKFIKDEHGKASTVCEAIKSTVQHNESGTIVLEEVVEQTR